MAQVRRCYDGLREVKQVLRANELTQWVKVTAAKMGGFEFSPRDPRWKERTSSQKLSSDFHMLPVARAHTHTCTHALMHTQ